MSIYRMSLRFNTDDETERKAAEYIQGLDCSRNRFVIGLIADHIERTEKEQSDDTLIEKIRLMFREEIQDISVVTATPKDTAANVTKLTEDEQAENAASVLADLEMFG